MRPLLVLLPLLALAGCGGGGGGAPAATPVRLTAADLEIAPGSTTAELVVTLAALPTPRPALLQVTIELPPALTVASSSVLQPLQSLTTLRGERAGDRYLVVCGDDRTAAGRPLADGPLFRLRLTTSTPRQPGSHTVRLTGLVAANGDGSAAAAEATPALATVTVR